MPNASIIIPAYNTADYIEQTLDSILAQSYTDFEIIIIDDGSTDGTAEKVQAYEDDRIRYFYQPNSGRPSGPRNRAIAMAQGDIIFMFDSDDLMLPDKLRISMEAFELAPWAGMVFTGFCCIDEDNQVINPNFLADYTTLGRLPKHSLSRDIWLIRSRDAAAGLAYSNFIGTSSVAIRKAVFEQVGLFDTEVRNADDKLMWSAIANEFDLVYIPPVYHQYRVRRGSISLRNIAERAEGIVTVLRKMKNLPLPNHCYRELDRQIALRYFEQGYDYFTRYQLGPARRAFWHSLRMKPGWRAVFYGLLSLMPSGCIKGLKAVKHTVRA